VFPSDPPLGLSADDVLVCISKIRQEVPFEDNPALLAVAHDIMLLFHYICAPSWRLAMAVCLNQKTRLHQMRQRAPKVWAEVRARLAADESSRSLSVVMQL
jgi:hypothetical protein